MKIKIYFTSGVEHTFEIDENMLIVDFIKLATDFGGPIRKAEIK